MNRTYATFNDIEKFYGPFLALPQMWQAIRVYNQPRPEEAPKNYPIWPLWYVAWAFRLTRRAGGLFVLGLILDLIYPIHL